MTLSITGFAAGQYYNHYGGASDYQCLPLHPEHSATSAATSSRNYIYGAEYEAISDVFSTVAQDQNVPCALCYTAGRSTTVTIPAKRNCPEKWTKVMVHNWWDFNCNLTLLLIIITRYTHMAIRSQLNMVIMINCTNKNNENNACTRTMFLQ